jgi:hypothetical protein
MGNPPIIKFNPNPPPSPPMWTHQKGNGILWCIDNETHALAREKLPPAEGLARDSKHQVVVPHPEVGAVRITFQVKRAAGRYKSAKPFWSACWAEQVKEKPPEGG